MAEFDQPLLEAEAGSDPIALFGRWYEEAARHVRLVEAVALATADANGKPSARMVLLKGYSSDGFDFYTHYDSRKGQEIAVNPVAALLFNWDPLGRQVRIEGAVTRLSEAESDEYFASRPLGSRIGAVASRQSRPIEARDELDARVQRLSEELGDQVPRPQTWGGYRVAPELMEFWQNREDRLHDRLCYQREPGGFSRVRLQP